MQVTAMGMHSVVRFIKSLLQQMSYIYLTTHQNYNVKNQNLKNMLLTCSRGTKPENKHRMSLGISRHQKDGTATQSEIPTITDTPGPRGPISLETLECELLITLPTYASRQ